VADFVRVLAVSDLAPGQATEVTIEGTPVAIYNVNGAFYATSNVCLHRGGPLGQGMLDGTAVMCPWHAWSWDVTTGENTANPALKIQAYEVKVAEGQVLVKLG